MNKKYFLLIYLLLLFSFQASAQFFVTGDDPGRLKWKYIDTESYRVIYPSESDSLAHVYARKLEKFKVPVSRTTGYMTGSGDGELMPVILHTYNGANGSVAWAPKRMDLFTLPDAYDVDPLPWSTMLSVHESRHVTQMQFGMTNNQKPFNYVFGEMWNILVSLLYPAMHFIEGDAVIAETALTNSGRGRTADFLNYYRIAFDNGDFRNWSQWRFGSQRNYYPNYYALGYMTMANIRTMYDRPMFAHESYELASRKIFKIRAFKYTAEQYGEKKFGEIFDEICHAMNEQWQQEDRLRGPFMSYEQISKEPRLYTNYKDNIAVGEDIYSIKSGYLNTPELVRIDKEGKEHLVTRFSYNTSKISWSDYFQRIYWSEDLPDERWSLKKDSRIRYIENGKTKKRTLKGKENLTNPATADKDSCISATVYRVDGKSVLSVIDGHNGKVVETFEAPDSLQLVETAWIGNTIYATAVSDGGFGIYALEYHGSEEWKEVLAPQPVKIKDFKSIQDELMFTCDRSGVNELYHFIPSESRLIQKTNTRYGASDFTYSPDGEYLYFSAETLKGLQLGRIKSDSLLCRTVRYDDIKSYPLAEKLTEQEKKIARLEGDDETVPSNDNIHISKPKKYSKGGHMFNIHSWAPVYVSVDNIMNMSFDKIYEAASLGVSGIMQNRLSTGVGEFGYSAHKDPYNHNKWRHSGHAKFTYSGLYPVIETSLNFNDRGARQYYIKFHETEESTSIEFSSKELDHPYVNGNIKTYIPFNFSSGGWNKGIVPQLNYTITNDVFYNGITVLSYESVNADPVIKEELPGRNRYRHSITGSVRGYTMLGTPNSFVYPKWGVGLEIGASGSIGTRIGNYKVLSPMGYAYLYGYVPGIISGQGIKLTAMHQHSISKKSYFNNSVVNTLPRGLSNNIELLNWLSIRNDSMTRLTFDYGIPIYIGDWGIFGGFFYFKRLVLTPHFDYTFAGKDQLYSAGCDLTFDLNSILWLGWPCSVGVTYSYNGGKSFDSLKASTGIHIGRHFVGPTFNVSF